MENINPDLTIVTAPKPGCIEKVWLPSDRTIEWLVAMTEDGPYCYGYITRKMEDMDELV
jgi:hypothetical protein